MSRINSNMLPGCIHNTINYGRLEIINYQNSKQILVRFIDTGYEVITNSSDILKRSVKDRLMPHVFGVGFIGVGNHQSRVNKKRTPAYQCWVSILQRCYDENNREHAPTYADCSVAPEWHNFQNFAAWYESNYPKGNGLFHIDKDIKVPGNRVYSPDTAQFVTPSQNSQEVALRAFTKNYRFINPEGNVVALRNLSLFSKQNGLCVSAMCQVASGKRDQHRGWKAA